MYRELSCHETFHAPVSQRENANPLSLEVSRDVLPGNEVKPSPPYFSVSLPLTVLFPIYFQCVQNFQVEALGLEYNEKCWGLCGATQPEGNHSDGTMPWTGRNCVMVCARNLTMPSKHEWPSVTSQGGKNILNFHYCHTPHRWLTQPTGLPCMCDCCRKIVLSHKDLFWNSSKANYYRIPFLVTIREGGSNLKKKCKCLQLLASK